MTEILMVSSDWLYEEIEGVGVSDNDQEIIWDKLKIIDGITIQENSECGVVIIEKDLLLNGDLSMITNHFNKDKLIEIFSNIKQFTISAFGESVFGLKGFEDFQFDFDEIFDDLDDIDKDWYVARIISDGYYETVSKSLIEIANYKVREKLNDIGNIETVIIR